VQELRSFMQAIQETGIGWRITSLTVNLKNVIGQQFQLLIYARSGGWEVRYHIADYAEKIKMAAV
jgi:hypothetical protein